VFIGARYWIISWSSWIEFTPSKITSFKSILILSSHSRLELSSLNLSHACYIPFPPIIVRGMTSGMRHMTAPHSGSFYPEGSVFILTERNHCLTNCTEQSAWQADSHSASQEITHLLYNTKFHYRVHKSPPQVPILSQMQPVYPFPP
jgi:hypothetical protein